MRRKNSSNDFQLQFFPNGPDYKKIIGEKSGDWKIDLLYNCDEPQLKVLIEKYLPPGILYNVFDTTCHIMTELNGDEKNGIFGSATVDELAKKAYHRSENQLRLEGIVHNEQAIAALAIWNMLLPESVGGVYPNNTYNPFMENLTGILQSYKNTIKDVSPIVFSPGILSAAFLGFKALVIDYYKLPVQIPEQHLFSNCKA